MRHAQAESKGGAEFRRQLESIKDRFTGYHCSPNAQARGYALEEILYDLFLLFEMNPRGSFRRIGEQIDGSFTVCTDHFLLEAKWQSERATLHDLRDLDGAVGSSLDNTLGLFVSLNGFTPDAIGAYVQGSRPRIVCMDGQDLMAVLEGRIELPDLLQRKQDLAIQKRSIFVSVSDILRGAG